MRMITEIPIPFLFSLPFLLFSFFFSSLSCSMHPLHLTPSSVCMCMCACQFSPSPHRLSLFLSCAMELISIEYASSPLPLSCTRGCSSRGRRRRKYPHLSFSTSQFSLLHGNYSLSSLSHLPLCVHGVKRRVHKKSSIPPHFALLCYVTPPSQLCFESISHHLLESEAKKERRKSKEER